MYILIDNFAAYGGSLKIIIRPRVATLPLMKTINTLF